MSLINYSRYKYTPDEIEQEAFLTRFVIRTQEFDDLYQSLCDGDYAVPQQHCIVVGQRGQGKTTLLRRLMIAVENNEQLSTFLIPVKFAEEQYQIRSLSRLWEEVADYLQSIYPQEFHDILDQMEAHFDDDDYELTCFSLLENYLICKDRKLLLLIDNIDELLGKLKTKEQHQLREILISSPSFRIIGGSTKMLERNYDYGKPFYEYFQIIRLQGLTTEECHGFLRIIGEGEQREKINQIINETPQRIEILRRLTGGVPRTMVMLFDIFVDDEGNAFEDLLKVLDEATPLYKHRMDDLPATLQDITHVIAMNWDGLGTGEIAQKTRLQSKEVSAQLKQLENKYGMIVSTSTGKNKLYQLEERFFNIWYLMRFGRKKDRQRVEWLVRFLTSWCTPQELEQRALKFVTSVQGGDVSVNYAYYMCEALGYAGLSAEAEYQVKENTRNYLLSKDSELAAQISSSENESLGQILSLNWAEECNHAIALCESKNFNHPFGLSMLCSLYLLQGRSVDKAVSVARKAGVIADSPEYQTLAMGFQDHLILIHATVKLWAEKFNESFDFFDKYLNSDPQTRHEDLISFFILLLMSKGQYQKAKHYFEKEEYQLKDRLKPIWFALMTLMQDEFPNEIKKMGSELQETVDEMLARVKRMESKYAISD